MKKIKQKDISRAFDLIALLQDDNVDAETKEEIREWFWSGMSEDAKEAALEQFFYTLAPESPNALDYQKYEELAKRLGFDKIRTENMPLHIPQKPRITLSRRIVYASTAAVAAFLAGTTIFFIADKPAENHVVEEIVKTSTENEKRDIVLPDGSTVRVSASSTIEYPADFNENRRITLDGEAYFNVARDEEHPFTVGNGEVQVTVLGTEFNVKGYSSDPVAEIALVTGQVTVSAGTHNIVMRPGQKAVADRYSLDIALTEAGRGELMRLRGDNLTLDDVRIDEALQIVADYFGMGLFLPSDMPDDAYVNISTPGSMPIDDVLVSITRTVSSIGYRIEDNTIRIVRQ